MQRVIITGPGGFIGGHLLKRLWQDDIEIVAVCFNMPDNETVTEWRKHNMTIVSYEEKSLRGLSEGYDVLFDLAWGGVAGPQRADYHMQLGNVINSLDWMNVAAEAGCKKLVISSSISELECELFMREPGFAGSGRFVYSASKLVNHYLHKALSAMNGIECVNAYIGNAFGENGSDSLLVHYTISKLLKGEPTRFSSCTQPYDFIYVEDVVNGLIAVAENGIKNHAYYLGSGNPRELKEYLLIIRDYICPTAELGIGALPTDSHALPIEVFDIQRTIDETGYHPQYTFEEGLDRTVRWYVEH